MTETQTAEEATQNETADQAEVSEAELPEAGAPGARGGGGQIGILLEATVPVTASLGEAEMTVRELLAMGPGSVMELDRAAGEPVDLMLRGTCFAKGRLVVTGEKLGVRIEEILDTAGPEA